MAVLEKEKDKPRKKPGPKHKRGYLSKHAEQELPEDCHQGPLPSVKHERFAQFLFQGIDTRTAYEKAGFKWNNGNAYRLKDDKRIVKRVREMHEQAAKVASIDASLVLSLLLEIAQIHALRTPAAAVAALKLIGQTDALPLFMERSKADINLLDTIQRATPEERVALIQELSAKLGVTRAEDLLDG